MVVAGEEPVAHVLVAMSNNAKPTGAMDLRSTSHLSKTGNGKLKKYLQCKKN